MPEFDYLEALLLVAVGLVAGFINTVAGGGTLLTLPILIFLGLDSSVANGTNRVSIFFQNMSSVAGFKSKGVSEFPFSIRVGLSALVGAILGARISVDINNEVFNQILAVVMIAVVAVTIFNPIKNPTEALQKMSKKHQTLSIIVFFFIGIYGGFIQAGVGFIILAALTFINNISLVKANSIKVFVVFTFTIAAIAVFIYENQIDWVKGLTLAVGSSTGAWIASRWSVGKADVWIKRFMIVMVTVLAISLFFKF
ncbi:MAG: sulfite exporter TauE/SafE family protein [Flavobacteriales bacterium]|nr:sulfite exporter TauE/SafE family protein [Flavobacteriales bacterium]